MTQIFEEYEFNNIPPSLDEMELLMDTLLKYPDDESGWELFKEMFDAIICKGRYFVENHFPDPLSFCYFREDYGDHPGMEDIVRRHFSIYYPIGENNSMHSAKSMILYLRFTIYDQYGWDYFKELFKTLTEEEQKIIIACFCEYFEIADTEAFTSFLLE